MSIEYIDTKKLSRSTMGARVVKSISPTLFWVHLIHCDGQFREMLEDLNIYMERKKDKLILIPDCLTEKMEVAVRTNNGWQRAIIIRINNDRTVKLNLRDWGTYLRCPNNRMYILEDQFRKLAWHAIPCGLAYAGPTTPGLWWSQKTRELTRVLTEQQEGYIKIIKPIKTEGALVQLHVAPLKGEFTKNLLDTLVKLGHAKKTSTPAIVVYPSVNV